MPGKTVNRYRFQFFRNVDFRSAKSLKFLAGEEVLEPPTPGFGDRCSNQLSYTPRRAALADLTKLGYSAHSGSDWDDVAGTR
jgi:hypothetical protein